jgi:hypothetical protein
VVINWYGTRDKWDFPFNLRGADNIAREAVAMGMKIAICYEDWTTVADMGVSWGEEPTGTVRTAGLEQMRLDFEYIRDNYTSKSNYLKDETGAPLVLIFGPRNFMIPADWSNTLDTVFAGQPKPKLISLSGRSVGDGHFSWFGDLSSYDSTKDNETQTLGNVATYLSQFYGSQDSTMGSAFPGFHDYYAEGNNGTSYGQLPTYNGQTLEVGINQANTHFPPFLQLATWNDWGEGTCFEPTQEEIGTPASHFRHLLNLQQHLTSHQDEASFVTTTCQFWQSIAYEVNHTDWPVVGLCGAGAAVGDPHLQNVHGERFDLMKPGRHVLINIPRGKRAEDALLRVQAEARRLGGSCADMYFQELNVTGSWAEARQAGGYRYVAGDAKTRGWLALGQVELKVVHGRTESGIQYLNFFVKHLSRTGFAVGGLLGEDDHEDVIIPPPGCDHRLVLAGYPSGVNGHIPPVPSSPVAVAGLA